jgi:hypothetical protein
LNFGSESVSDEETMPTQEIRDIVNQDNVKFLSERHKMGTNIAGAF